MLREPLEQYLDRVRPHYLVADMFFTWSTEVASKFNIPRLVFHGTCYFALCAEETIRLHQPFKGVSYNDHPPCVLPFLPHEIKFTRVQVPDYLWKQEESEEVTGLQKLHTRRIKQTEVESFGVIVNSFYELEPDYSDFYNANLRTTSWHVGPLSLCNTSLEDKTRRGPGQTQAYSGSEGKTLLEWLDSKRQDSVIYVGTGSIANFTRAQLHEVAMGLEASQQHFIWVVKTDDDDDDDMECFEHRMEGKGLIIRGWAPQMLILEHKATGAFVTHFGWNSTLEGIFAGVPMVTWPGGSEQFYIEKLVTQILNIGIPVGAKKWSLVPYSDDCLVKGEMIEKALTEIMKGDEAQERRVRANKLKEMAPKVVEENGSSYSDLGDLINELRYYHDFIKS